MWTCSCGRRVPDSVAQCRCGKPRSGSSTSSSRAEVLEEPQARPPATTNRSGTAKVVGLLVVIALYFGSRLLNRYNVSKDARRTAVQALGQVLDKEHAEDMVRRHHDACFDQFYTTGWGRRQSARFETEKYAKCVIDRVMASLDKEGAALRHAAAPTPRPARETSAPVATPMPEAPLRGEWGQATLGDVKVTEFKRSPQLTFAVEFVALGPKLTQRGQCVFQVNCDGQPPGRTVVVGCPLQVDGPKGVGRVRYSYDVAGPPTASCTLSLQLSDGYSTRSNEVAVPLG